MEIKLRDEVEDKYKWDLSKLEAICEGRNDIYKETKELADKLILKLFGN